MIREHHGLYGYNKYSLFLLATLASLANQSIIHTVERSTPPAQGQKQTTRAHGVIYEGALGVRHVVNVVGRTPLRTNLD